MGSLTVARDSANDNREVQTDELLLELANYVMESPEPSSEARDTARLCLMDSLGCAFDALSHPACVAHLGPVVPGASMEDGARVIGTGDRLDPVKAAFDNGTLIRWLDYNDTWLAAEWGHPSDNLGGLLAMADYRCRNTAAFGGQGEVSVKDLLLLLIQAHEIQGVLALENSFNRVGLDHVLLVKVATAGLAARMAGGAREEVTSALSHAWVDGQSLRTYRHAPNTSQRKSWAAGDATSRAVRLALMATQAGLPSLPSAISATTWGFADVLFGGRTPALARKLGCYVMENILFKVSFPAEFHAQTAAECAIELHQKVRERISEIARIEIKTQESAVRIISKTGGLRNYADRDHCIQYIVAVGLIEGDLRAEHYLDEYAATPEIDRLRSLTEVSEEKRYSEDYLNPDKRSIANAINVTFMDGSETGWVEVEYPLGHRRRREEAVPLLFDKFRAVAEKELGDGRASELVELFKDPGRLEKMPVSALVDLSCRC